MKSRSNTLLSPSLNAITFASLCALLAGIFLWLFLPASGPPDYGKLTFEDAAGGKVRLSDLADRPVMLHFFTTWCDQCETMAPALATVGATMTNDVRVVGVSLDLIPDFQLDDGTFDPDTRLEDVQRFARRHGSTHPILFDRLGHGAAALNGHEVPVQLIFDAETRLIRRFTGARTEAGLREILRVCLEEAGTDSRL